jgi:hypothetical protein
MYGTVARSFIGLLGHRQYCIFTFFEYIQNMSIRAYARPKFWVFKAVNIKFVVFWVFASYVVAVGYQRFGEIPLPIFRITSSVMQCRVELEDGYSTVLRSVGAQPPHYTVQQPRKPRLLHIQYYIFCFWNLNIVSEEREMENILLLLLLLLLLLVLLLILSLSLTLSPPPLSLQLLQITLVL